MERPFVLLPIGVLPLFPVLDWLLLELLRGLTPADWQRPAPRPSVGGKRHSRPPARRQLAYPFDAARRLLRRAPGRNSSLCAADGLPQSVECRVDDGRPPPEPGSADGTTGDFWGRIHAVSGHTPWAPATFAVGWAGESESQNWFHIVRDYTEKWHQQQIREAVGQPEPLLTLALFRPFFETVVRVLPHVYRAVGGHGCRGAAAREHRQR